MLCETEVGDFDVTVCAEEDVFGLEVSVDDVEGMEVVEGEGDFGCVELCDRVGETLERWKKRAGR